jgi:hypothetical protein
VEMGDPSEAENSAESNSIRPGSPSHEHLCAPRRAPASPRAPDYFGHPLSPPYPPATGVGAPRAARAARGHGQLRAVEAGVDSEEDRAELQPRGHGRAVAQSGPSLRPGRLQLASPEWAVAAAAVERTTLSMRCRPMSRPLPLGPAPSLSS